ncbi:hypothetical protein CMI37_17445 [Candidatus Pacearchaeota archaeon]|nr:hypothetical protein [Candidatus Pacearchaeota archaeon]|tara:strand:+ start:23 stop:274 length:252 start_codon:yes stop_codon:yes gene_type:complete
MEKINTNKILKDIHLSDLTVSQLSKKYHIKEKEIEDMLEELEKKSLIKIDYCDEDIGAGETKEVMMNLYITNKGKELLKNIKQ